MESSWNIAKVDENANITIQAVNMKTINLPIPDKEAFIEECEAIKKKQMSESCDNGLFYFDAERLQTMFAEHIKQYGIPVKITRGWAHYLTKGGARAVHSHTTVTGLYYLKIPKNSSKMWFEDTKEVIEPVEDNFMIFEANRPHGITNHEGDTIRWAIAFECERIGQ